MSVLKTLWRWFRYGPDHPETMPSPLVLMLFWRTIAAIAVVFCGLLLTAWFSQQLSSPGAAGLAGWVFAVAFLRLADRILARGESR